MTIEEDKLKIEGSRLEIERLKLDLEEKKLLVDAWKQVVTTQMHFNDLELRIRNFAFVLTGAFIALGGYALKEGGAILIPIIVQQISIASAIIFSSIPPLLGFYFMDRWWYHPLLMGSVLEGAKLETVLTKRGVHLTMGQNISWQSGMLNWLIGQKRVFSADEKQRYESQNNLDVFDVWQERNGKYILRNGLLTKRSFRSHHKMMTFYGILIVSMLILGTAVKDVGKVKAVVPQGGLTAPAH